MGGVDRRAAGAIAFFFVLLLPVTGWAQARAVRVFVDDLPVATDVPPRLESGRVLVPLRAVGEAFTFAVAWDERTRTATVRDGAHVVTLRPGERRAYKDGRAVPLDVPARLVNGRILVPLRFVGEAFDAYVEWRQDEYAVRARSPRRPVTVLGYYALGSREASSWRDLYGADYPHTGKGNTDLVRDVALGWYTLDASGNLRTDSDTGWRRPEGWEDVLAEAEARGLRTEMVVHATDGDGTLTRLLADEEAQARAARAIALEAAAHYDGAQLDLEGLGRQGTPEELQAVRARFVRFVERVRAELDAQAQAAGRSLRLTLALHPPNGAYRGYDYGALGRVTDRIVIMAYEYGTRPEPVAKVEEAVRLALAQVSRERLLLGISLASEDHRSLVAKVGLAKRYRLAGIALWRLGIVQPEEWDVLRAMVSGR